MRWATLFVISAVALTLKANDVTLAARIGNVACKEPDDIQAAFDAMYKLEHWSFYNSPTFRDGAFQNVEVYIGNGALYSDPVEGPNTKKAKAMLRKFGGNICPAYYKLQFDENRIPQLMKQANCRSERCLFTGKRGRKKLCCEKVWAYTPVLRRDDCKDGVWTYKRVLEPVAVACSCNLKKPP